MTREHTDERNPAPGYAPEDDQEFDPSTDDFVSKERNYTHFDLPLSENERRDFRADPDRIAQNSFWPLLGFTKVERRVRYDRVRGRYVEPKPRDIKFGSHKDAALLQHYAYQLSEHYEEHLSGKPFSSGILAYRTGMGDNVTQARDLISEIKDRKDVIAVAMDIKGFFDNIDHGVLFAALQKVLREDRLSEHHFRIFQRMTRFEWVESEQLERRLGRKGSVGGRICSVHEFRTKVRRKGDSLVNVNDERFGIPQGTPLSGLYANISMLEFDRIMHNYVAQRGGSYRRYSDDIAVLIPFDANLDLLTRHVNRQLKKIGLRVNPNKTEISTFRWDGAKLSSDRQFQYLGFTFDGSRTLIRASSIHKYYRKMSRGVRAKIRAAFVKGIPRETVFMRELFRKYTHFGRTRNFPRYAYRAAKILNAPEIRAQLRGHVPKFKRVVRYHADRVYGADSP